MPPDGPFSSPEDLGTDPKKLGDGPEGPQDGSKKLRTRPRLLAAWLWVGGLSQENYRADLLFEIGPVNNKTTT